MLPQKMFRFIILLFFILSCISLASVIASTENNSDAIFKNAQDLFNQALQKKGEEKRILMLKSALHFESLVDEFNIQNGYLYYNIGNAYYEAGEYGKSILNYRRAQRLIINNQDLEQNLQLARQELNIPPSKEEWGTQISKSIFFWHYLLSYSTRNYLFIGIFSLFWILLAISIFKRHIFLFSAELILGVTALALGGSMVTSAYMNSTSKEGVVTANKATPRKGPGLGYQRYFEEDLINGTEFEILEERKIWWKVRLQNREVFWLKEELLEKI